MDKAVMWTRDMYNLYISADYVYSHFSIQRDIEAIQKV